MSVTVSQAAKRVSEFNKMARSICNDIVTAQELVQELFLKLCLIEKEEGGLDRLSFFNVKTDRLEINTFYCYRIMTNVYLDYLRRDKVIYVEQYEDLDLADSSADPEEIELDYQKAKADLLNEVEQSLKELHWYDAKLFEHYQNEVKSVRELAEETGISHTSIYNTIRNVKEAIKESTRKSKIKAYNRTKNNIG